MGMKLKNCCGCCELKMGVTIIGLLLAFIAMLQVVFGIITLSIGLTSKIAGSILIVSGVIKFVSDVVLVVGCAQYRRSHIVPWLVIQLICILAYVSFGLVMIGFGVKVLDGTPQDEKVITLTGLTGAGLFTSGYVSIIIGPILLVASGFLIYFWIAGYSLYQRMGLSTITHP